MLDDPFQNLFKEEDRQSLEKILSELLNAKDIELKSEIKTPSALTKLKILSIWLRQKELPKSADLLDAFIENYLKYMVSHNRESRREIVQALSEMFKREPQFAERLMGDKIK